MTETLDEFLTRVRDYDQHTSDDDIDRLVAEIERLRAEVAIWCRVACPVCCNDYDAAKAAGGRDE